MKGIFSIQQVIYFGFGVALLAAVIFLMSSFYTSIQPLALRISMDDVIKTLNTASLKLYSEGKSFNAEDSVIYLKIPKKVAGYKYRITFNNTANQFCFVYPENYCRDTYLLNENFPINADIDSSEDVHYMQYKNNTIWVV